MMQPSVANLPGYDVTLGEFIRYVLKAHDSTRILHCPSL